MMCAKNLIIREICALLVNKETIYLAIYFSVGSWASQQCLHSHNIAARPRGSTNKTNGSTPNLEMQTEILFIVLRLSTGANGKRLIGRARRGRAWVSRADLNRGRQAAKVDAQQPPRTPRAKALTRLILFSRGRQESRKIGRFRVCISESTQKTRISAKEHQQHSPCIIVSRTNWIYRIYA